MTNGFFASFVEGRRGEILDAALEVFAEHGYEGGTMRRIAQRVGFTEPALYRHYASKEALLVDLVSEAGTHLASTATRQLESRSGGDFAEVLLSLLRERRGLLHVNLDLFRTLLTATTHNAPAREAFRATIAKPMQENLGSLIRRIDAAAGIVRPEESVRASARTMMSLLIGHMLTTELLEEDGSDEDLVAVLAQMMGWTDAI